MKAVLKSYVPRFTFIITRGDDRPVITLPASLLLLTALLVIASLIWSGSRLAATSNQANESAGKQARLQAMQQQLQTQLTRKQAELALRDSQISGLKQQIHQDEQDRHFMQQRLSMFDDVLAARVVAGVHILNPEAYWRKQDGHINYQLVLVKGENYPRWALGHMQFTARLADGKIIALSNTRGQTNIKYEITTHQFMEGTLLWDQQTAPTSLHVTLISKSGKNVRQADFPVLSFSSTQTATEEAQP